MKKKQEPNITFTKIKVKTIFNVDYKEYMACIDESLIALKLEERIRNGYKLNNTLPLIGFWI